MEEKLKKVTTERAPVAPAAGSGGGRGGRGGLGAGSTLLDALTRQGGNDLPIDLSNLIRPGRTPEGAPATPGAAGGAAAAAGVLTAVDEDEGDEEADVPKEFDYFTDGEEEDE